MRRTVRLSIVAGVLALFTAVPVPPALATPRPPDPRPAATADAISTTVDLGSYAVNGPVHAAVVDETTGNTYIGGPFSRIGKRTGSVAAVDPPDTSSGALRAGSPEILGNVGGVFTDDRAGDPGVLVVGRISAINGVKLPNRPAWRLHLVNDAWVLDTAWSVQGTCPGELISQFPIGQQWIATPKYLITGHAAGPRSGTQSTTGLVVIDRSSGQMKNVGGPVCSSAETLLESIPNLPEITSCGSQIHCEAYVSRIAWDATSSRLAVEYWFVVGGQTPSFWSNLVGYDLNASTGGRKWIRPEYTGSKDDFGRYAGSTSLGSLPGMFVARGQYPFDQSLADGDLSRLLLVSATTGAIVERWTQGGEVTGQGTSTPCETGRDSVGYSFSRVGSDLYGWAGNPAFLCRYQLTGGLLTSTQVGSVTFDVMGSGRTPPLAPYTAGDGTAYLLGSDSAVDLTHATSAAWNPDPAMDVNAGGPMVAASGGAVVLGGSFRFLQGTEARGVAALDPSLAPLAGFTSGITPTAAIADVETLALTDGQVLAGGRYLSGQAVIGLDAATGSVSWLPNVPLARADAIVRGAAGDVWIGGLASIGNPAQSLLHLNPGANSSGLAQHTFGCLPGTNDGGDETPTCDSDTWHRTRVSALLFDTAGRLYVSGAFGSVDGQTRPGLARFNADGSLDTWSADLAGSMPLPATGGIAAVVPHAMAILGDQLVVGGRFANWYEDSYGIHENLLSQLLVYSVATGSLIRPADGTIENWFEDPGWEAEAWAMLPTDAGLVVALGAPGIGIFDATTLDWDATASAGWYDTAWYTRVEGSGIFALAMPGRTGAAQPAGSVSTAVTGPTSLVIAGGIPRWKYRVAGNHLRTSVAPDTAAPSVTTLRMYGRPSATAGSPMPMRFAWRGADPHGSGVARYQVQLKTGDGSWVTITAATAAPRTNALLKRGTAYRFRVRATDYAGNTGAWAYSPTFTVGLSQETSAAWRYSSGWSTVTSDAYSGGSTRKSKTAGAWVTYRFTGRSVAFVSTTGPTRGRAKVYVDGAYVKTIDLKSATTRYRMIVWTRSWSTSDSHVIRIVVKGTSGRPRIDADAFVVVR